MKILVIDDEKPTLSMFKLFLTAYGYDVFAAESGEEGLKIFNEISPDIVFTDIRMPGIDGLEVLRQIRQKDDRTQVIIITGHGDMEKAVEALDLDASDFINKPVERQALNSALSRAEKRNAMPKDMPFSFEISPKGKSILNIRIKGRLSKKTAAAIFSRIEKELKAGYDAIHFITDDSFSISRNGISALVSLIKKLKTYCAEVAIENLSYNFVRVFQMAGMEKYATLIEEEPVE